MKLLALLFACAGLMALTTVTSQLIPNTNDIYIGPYYYTIGINLNMSQYAYATTYNILDITNATSTYLTIQSAVTKIGLMGGGVIYIKEGTYTLLRNIDFAKGNIKFTGDGMDATILKLVDYSPSFIIGTSKKSGFIRTRMITNFIVANMTIDGNKARQFYDDDSIYGKYGLFTEGCTNVWFDNVKVTNFQGYGFDPHGWKSVGIYGNNLTITNCISENNNWDGFTLDQTYNIVLIGNKAYNNGRHGFNIVTGAKFGQVINNTAYYNGYYDPHLGSGCGIMVQNNQEFGTGNISLVNNHLYHNKKAGICLNDVFNITAINNNIGDTCTCFNIVKQKTTQIFNNKCFTKKLVVTSGTTISYNVPFAANYSSSITYIYGNAFKIISTCPS